MIFKKKMTSIAISLDARNKLKSLADEIKQKTGSYISIGNIIQEYILSEIQLTKQRILNQYYTITNQQAAELLKELNND